MQNQKSALGLDGNVAALIGYPIGIVALISVFIEKDNKFVRFHAFQSLLFWAAIFVIYIGLVIVMVFFAFISSLLATLFWLLLVLAGFGVLAGIILLAYKAFQGEMFKLPVIGDMAEKWA
ncbi:MAG TPA: DUF4870 domain-containing protein [Pyrinomonadaceae bacterium]|jgi:uncharacterized membrane protein